MGDLRDERDRLQDERDREFGAELERMPIRKLEEVRRTWALGLNRLEQWRAEVTRRVEAERVVPYSGGLRAGPKAEAWECEPEGLCRVLPCGARVYDSVRNDGEGRVLVVRGRGGALNLSVGDAVKLREVLGEFLAMGPVAEGERTLGDVRGRPIIDPGSGLTAEEAEKVLEYLSVEVEAKLRTALFARAGRAGLGMRIDLLPPGPDDDSGCVWEMNAVLGELGWPQRRMADLRGYLEEPDSKAGLAKKLGRPVEDIRASRVRIHVRLSGAVR